MNATDANDVFIILDSISKPNLSQLINSTGPFAPTGLTVLAQLPITDTSWEIPSSVFGGRQGRSIRTDTTYYFSIWVRYNSGDAGGPVTWRHFLGDEMNPRLPPVTDSIGQTAAILRFSRPLDQTSKFDTLFHGPIASIVAKWWPGDNPSDSVVDKLNLVQSTSIPIDKLRDPNLDSFRLELRPLKFYTHYMYLLIVTDSVGRSSTSTPQRFTTRDSIPPTSVADLAATLPDPNTLVLSWKAATDSFHPSGPNFNFPNHHIGWYTVSLDGKPVDSVDLSVEGDNLFRAGAPRLPLSRNRFQWTGSQWQWTWPNLRPGKDFSVSVSVRDISGNTAVSAPELDSTAKSTTTFNCPTSYVAVGGTSTIGNFCIEEREHRSGASVAHSVTWAEAIATCDAQGAFLCSDSQWVRACESLPNGGSVEFGSIEAGRPTSPSKPDSLAWLSLVCNLGSGDSSALTAPPPDPRCVSGWGAYDMPGGVAEWTRDVYHSKPFSTGLRDAHLAWTDTSDLTGKANLGTIHGGSWLQLDQADRTLPSARCRERNYPAYSTLYDTLPDKTTRRHPNPDGISNGVGFRCCRAPGP